MRLLIQFSRYLVHPLAWRAYVQCVLAALLSLYACGLRLLLGCHYARYTCGRSLVVRIRPDIERWQRRCQAAETALGRLLASATTTLRRLHAY